MYASNTVSRTRCITVTAMLSAVAFLLMFLEISLPMLIPSFVKLDISDLPALLGSFALGPVYGVLIEVFKNLLHILIKGTSSAGIGELFNVTMGAVFVLVAGLIYWKDHTRRGAIIGSLAGAVCMALASLPMNYFLVYPFYATLFGGMDTIVSAYQAILPGVDGLFECLLIFNVPFTLVKGLIDVGLCFLIYKPLSGILHQR
ncbi:MAG: ECF transporter S component [Clostridiales bacterium]|nr:ECF transporter S component [Clostridiales bacterium]